ncbi:MAG: Prolipoprotein diacylglyceryl transferase [Candidatus Roizmanbacteria bacterium GW2011_GWA2_34_18]|uniref:Prolipoprotein diacylglyceryl transferase n=1 Tax=Candidatus Roizmanbacteria bacterium GW2011_GWA2_34_18 TaxID=1618477 RepID=A0A0G0DAB0_9BACT|nr:MAG: Prolipoprotein diacylglyceryl transferase [Candidatus Roizmanbacteria bacterium GW2011_GWA2_34_18]
MLPVLLNLGFLKIYTFGVFLVLGFFWATFLLWKNIRLTSLKEKDVFDGLFISLLGALFFGRLVYVILNFKDFGFNLLKFILINGYPGISLYGSIFGGLLVLYLFSGSRKINFNELIDYFVSPLFIALVFGKVGAFFSGVEIGTKTNFLLKIKYVGFDGLRHLVGLYEGLMFIIGVLIAYKILFEIRKEKYYKGFLLKFFIWFLALTIFLFDKIKDNRLYFVGLSLDFLVSLIILLTTSFYFVYYFKSDILSFIKNYGQKIFKTVRSRSKKKIGRGKEKKS